LKNKGARSSSHQSAFIASCLPECNPIPSTAEPFGEKRKKMPWHLFLSAASAHRVASYLKTSHGATRVLLFGSALAGKFSPGHSDIDLYFEGVPYECELAVTGMTFCAFPDLELDLFPLGPPMSKASSMTACHRDQVVTVRPFFRHSAHS
jgi:hypothetical protein